MNASDNEGLSPYKVLQSSKLEVISEQIINQSHTPHVVRRQFGAGLLLFHSQLLKDSWLVSLPPLSDMLKFRGLSRLAQVQHVI